MPLYDYYRRIIWMSVLVLIACVSLTSCHGRYSAPLNASDRGTPALKHLMLIGEPKWSSKDHRLLVLAFNKREHKEYVIVLLRNHAGFSLQYRVAIPIQTRSAHWIGGSGKIVLNVVDTKNKYNRIILFDLKTFRSIILCRDGFESEVNRNGTKMIFVNGFRGLWVYDLVNHKRSFIRGIGRPLIPPEPGGEWSPDGAYYAFLRLSKNFGHSIILVAHKGNNPRARVLVRNITGFVTFGVGWLDNRVLFGRYGELTSDKQTSFAIDPQSPKGVVPWGAPNEHNSFAIYSVGVKGGSVSVETPPGLAPPPDGEAMWLDNGKVGYPVVDKGDRYVIVEVRTKHIHDITIKGGSNIASYSFSHNAKWLAVINLRQDALLIVNCNSGHIVKFTYSNSHTSSPGTGGKR